MIFLDTSAIYALASRSDVNHTAAVRAFKALLERGEAVLLHNYILIEAFALLQSRLGLQAALAFERDCNRFEIEWIDPPLHAAAVSRWASGKRGISLVDHVSFIVMERRGIDQAFAFDDDFQTAGFRLLNA